MNERCRGGGGQMKPLRITGGYICYETVQGGHLESLRIVRTELLHLQASVRRAHIVHCNFLCAQGHCSVIEMVSEVWYARYVGRWWW